LNQLPAEVAAGAAAVLLEPLGFEQQGRQLPAAPQTGQRLALLRKRRGVSQRALCQLVGCSQPTLIQLEKNDAGRLETLNAALIVLGAGAYLAPYGASKRFYSHAGTSSVHHGWQTPAPLLERLYSVFQFDLDPCSPTRDPKKAPVRAAMHYTARDDGLALPWFGTVFLNPPYGRALSDWMVK
jgi:transcriptional regulator with XRE-family HTH domain